MLRREGEDPVVSEKFYHALVQVVLLFGSEIWVLTAAMLHKIEGFHISFLRKVTGMKAQRLGDKTWQQEGVEKVLQAAWTKPLQDYTNMRQARVVEWVDLQTIFKVCANNTG